MKLFLMLEPSSTSPPLWEGHHTLVQNSARGCEVCSCFHVNPHTGELFLLSPWQLCGTRTPSSPKQHSKRGSRWDLFRDTDDATESKCLLCKVLRNQFASLQRAQKLHPSRSLCCFLLNFYVTLRFFL